MIKITLEVVVSHFTSQVTLCDKEHCLPLLLHELMLGGD